MSTTTYSSASATLTWPGFAIEMVALSWSLWLHTYYFLLDVSWNVTRDFEGGPKQYVSAEETLAIGIVFHGDQEDVSALVGSIVRASLAQPIHLFVKWNSAKSDISGVLENQTALALTFIPGESNIGFGAAHNQMMAEAFSAGHRYYLCLNPDGILHPDSLGALVNFAKNLNRPALVEAIQFPKEHPKPYNPFTGITSWCSGACLLIPAEIFERVGGFDDNIFMYCEDVDLSWRARARGYNCYVCQDAWFLHRVVEEKSKIVTKMMLESARYLGFKYGVGRFQEEVERIIVTEKFYPEYCYLPTLPIVDKELYDPGLQEWRQLLCFEVPRW